MNSGTNFGISEKSIVLFNPLFLLQKIFDNDTTQLVQNIELK